MEGKPNYYAIIPADVRYDEDLRANAKLLYGEITALSNKIGICYASNNYFAKLYKVDPSAISQWISQLKDKDYIEVNYLKEGGAIKYRAIKLTGIYKYKQVFIKDKEGYLEKTKENNTSINNIEEYKEGVYDYDWLDDN